MYDAESNNENESDATNPLVPPLVSLDIESNAVSSTALPRSFYAEMILINAVLLLAETARGIVIPTLSVYVESVRRYTRHTICTELTLAYRSCPGVNPTLLQP